MDRMKRIQAAMLAFVMVAVCISVIGAGDSDADSAISPDISWYNETDVSFKISTAEQLAGLAQLVNGGNTFDGKTLFLMNDIVLSGEWTPIGDGSRNGRTFSGDSFSGTFNGMDYVISGLKITSGGSSSITGDATAGLFGVVNGGTVKNVILDNISITSKNENAGAVAGVLCGGGTIEKCVAGLSVGTGNSISVTKGAGGIVGRVLVSGTVSYCQNLTAITGGGNCGGIAGIAYYTETNKKITIDHCTIVNE